MKFCTKTQFFFILFFSLVGYNVYAAGDSLKMYSDFPYFKDGSLVQDVFFRTSDTFTASVHLICFKILKNGDSLLVYRKDADKVYFKKGVNRVSILFRKTKGKSYVLPAFRTIIKDYKLIPPGNYALCIALANKKKIFDSVVVAQRSDTLLPENSLLYQGISTQYLSLLDYHKNKVFSSLFNRGKVSSLNKPMGTVDAFLDAHFKIDKYCEQKGLIARQSKKGDKLIIDIYKDSLFLGRYEMKAGRSLKDQTGLLENRGNAYWGNIIDNKFGNYQTLASQFRKVVEAGGNKELVGNVSVSTVTGNNQEAFSGEDNNYYEINGQVAFPVMGIPIDIEGYYTSQDRHRQAKSGYIHFHYDADKAKEELMKVIGGFNRSYSQTLSLGNNYQMIYGQFLNKLQTEKLADMGAMRQALSLGNKNVANLNPEETEALLKEQLAAMQPLLEDSLRHALASGADSSKALSAFQKKKAAVQKRYQKALKYYQKVIALQKKIEHYQTLLDQYKKTLYYDSALVFNKLRNIKNLEDLSYKDLAKKATGLLPDSKTKGIITGLTQFDAGMFPQYLSDYTMAGQRLKGVSAGYDIGFAKVGVSYGNTEYISGYNDVTTYKSYSGSMTFKPIFGQNIGFIYYGYSPARKLLSKYDFFKSTDVSLPSFRNPVHIMSVVYSGAISKYIDLKGEYAFSNEEGQTPEAAKTQSFSDRSAYNIHLLAIIPKTSVSLETVFENDGSAFKNSTLPVLMSGVKRVRISGKGDFFHAFLNVSLDYNYLLQNSLYSTGHNTRWGFQISTHSRRYPNLYLSYKPFSTFRSFSDTLDIPQKPILGSVWSGRVNYQIEKPGRAWRFALLYNQNESVTDTLKYGSTLEQGSIIYSEGQMMFSVDVGVSKVNTAIVPVYPAFQDNQYLDVTGAFPLFKNLNLSGGTQIARCEIGLSRYNLIAGGTYIFKKLPLALSINLRYGRYRLGQEDDWQPLYTANIQMSWHFKMKLHLISKI